jgi:hypothetical protein
VKKISKHLTVANVVAFAALFIALGGASYAAFKVPKNSVGSRQLKVGAVTSSKIKKGAIGAAQIDIGALGTVPNAAHANAADSATKATDAATAAKATEAAVAAKATSAENLGGLTAQQIIAAARPSCPADTVEVGGLCFERKERPSETTWTAALKACAADGRFLPTMGELAAFLVRVNPPEERGDDDEWVSDVWHAEDGTVWTYTFEIKPGANPSFDIRPINAGSKPFRCVTAPE